MKITKRLCYGVSENTPKEKLYVKKIILRSYKDPTKNINFMAILNNFKIYQYNYNDSKTSDYFFWQYVDDDGQKDWKHIDICSYQNNMESIFKMYKLLEICENTDIDIDAEVQYDDINNLLKDIDKDLQLQKEL